MGECKGASARDEKERLALELDAQAEARSGELLVAVSRFTLVAVLVYAVARAIFAPMDPLRWLCAAAMISVICVAATFLARRISSQAACRLYLGCQWLCITLLALSGGGISSASVEGYLLLVLAAGLLLGWRAALEAAFLSCATELGLTVLEANHQLPSNLSLRTPLTYFMSHVLFAFLLMAFVYHYARLVSASLLKANEELAERRRAEAALVESETRFENAFEYASIGMALVAPTGSWLKVNRSFCQTVGYSEAELLTKKFQDITHPDDHRIDLHFVERLLASETLAAKFEKRYVHKDGRLVWVDLSASLVKSAQGDPSYFICQFEDITEHKRLERERERAQNALRERVKELTTLHRVSQLLQSVEMTIPEMLQAIVKALPSGWQRTEAAAARVVFDYLVYQTENFRSTPWSMRAELHAFDGKHGVLEVVYLEEGPEEDEGPFLNEERHLINTLGEMIGTALRRKQAESHGLRQLEYITALHSVGIAVLSSRDRESILRTILDQVTGRLNADAAAIWTIPPHDSELEFAAGLGWTGHEARPVQGRLGDELARRVVAERRLISIADIATTGFYSERSPWLREGGVVAYCGVPLIAKGVVRGVLEVYHREAFVADADWLRFLEGLAGHAAIAIDSIEMFDGLQRSNQELSVAYNVTLEGWSKALDLRDKETEGHTARVTQLTVELAKSVGIGGDDLVRIRQGALLHDVGKLGIPDSVLLKQGPLTDEEWVVMRKHPSYAFEWLSSIDYLRPALDIPYAHHERWNGSGYPRGLKGEEIPLSARLFAVVDVFDALTSDRPYRGRWSPEKTLDYIRERAGVDFDPQVVEAFLHLMMSAAAIER